MSIQRKRNGLTCTFEKVVKTKDRRGNYVKRSSPETYTTTCAFIPERGSRAEVPGQQIIDVASLIVQADMPDVETWSRVYVRGGWWDIVTPPQYHHGTRHVRHWTMEVRRRPDDMPPFRGAPGESPGGGGNG